MYVPAASPRGVPLDCSAGARRNPRTRNPGPKGVSRGFVHVRRGKPGPAITERWAPAGRIHSRAMDRPPGWHPDPSGEYRERYWDGDRWGAGRTGQTAPRRLPAKRILAGSALGLLGVLTLMSLCSSPDKTPPPPPVTLTQTVTPAAPPPPPPPPSPTTGGDITVVPDIDRPHVPNHDGGESWFCRRHRWC